MSIKLLARFLAVVLAMSGPCALAADGLLEGYTWQNRLLLIFAPGADDPRLRAQNAVLAKVESGLIERDLVTLRLLPAAPVSIDQRIAAGSDSTPIYRKFAIDSRDFTVLLIGKDGGSKLRSDAIVASSTIFDLIDSMPMRQWEMRNQTSSNHQE